MNHRNLGKRQGGVGESASPEKRFPIAIGIGRRVSYLFGSPLKERSRRSEV